MTVLLGLITAVTIGVSPDLLPKPNPTKGDGVALIMRDTKTGDEVTLVRWYLPMPSKPIYVPKKGDDPGTKKVAEELNKVERFIYKRNMSFCEANLKWIEADLKLPNESLEFYCVPVSAGT